MLPARHPGQPRSHPNLQRHILTLPAPAPLGRLRLEVSADGVHGITFSDAADARETEAASAAAQSGPLKAIITRCEAQFAAYWAGTSSGFSLPLIWRGTPFQQRVWKALLQVPYADTCSYKALAQAIGTPGASRAVGAANRVNPWVIAVPCHRVIGANGHLTGYAGGLDRKRWLLAHEARRS